MFEQDWVMRQIDILVEFVARTILKKDSVKYEIRDAENMTDTDLLFIKLRDLVAKREICKAEDLLFESFKKDDPDFLTLALDFYRSVNRLSEEELEAHDFSRREVEDGVKEVARLCGLPEVPFGKIK